MVGKDSFATPPNPLPRPSAEAAENPRRVRLLIAGADDLLLSLQTHLFSAAEWCEVVGTARNCPEMIEKTALLKPDVVILDAELEYMDGITALKELRARRLPVKVVLASAADLNGNWVRLGADGFFRKWRPLSDLLEVVKDVGI
jgi:DNA-binding NarL/FixJ family response regulator